MRGKVFLINFITYVIICLKYDSVHYIIVSKRLKELERILNLDWRLPRFSFYFIYLSKNDEEVLPLLMENATGYLCMFTHLRVIMTLHCSKTFIRYQGYTGGKEKFM